MSYNVRIPCNCCFGLIEASEYLANDGECNDCVSELVPSPMQAFYNDGPKIRYILVDIDDGLDDRCYTSEEKERAISEVSSALNIAYMEGIAL